MINRPSEYFADPPMTPDEAAEEKLEIYAEYVWAQDPSRVIWIFLC